MRRLYVHHAHGLVGILEENKVGELRFAYARSWLQDPRAFPISVSLGLREEAYDEPAHAFFANLLPEGEVRRLICQRLGISIDNDSDLLAAIGGECAGALTVTSDEEPATRGEYRRLTAEALAGYAKTRILPELDGRAGLRLSLAGAQDKLPVLIDGDAIFLPVGNAPSTHILKFPNPPYKHLPANEVLVTTIARNLGLPVVDLELRKLRREGMCVVRRYDRVKDEDGKVRRLHQEDFCQVLGLRSARKYEKEGGPTFSSCFVAMRGASTDPLRDGQNLLEWLAFNVLAFNADAHAKNISLLHDASGTRLAPFYDLVCTRAYDRLARDLAMTVGGEGDPTLVRREHWEQLAGQLGLGARFVLRTVGSLAERFPAALREAVAEFRERYGENPILQMTGPKLRNRGNRVLAGLAS